MLAEYPATTGRSFTMERYVLGWQRAASGQSWSMFLGTPHRRDWARDHRLLPAFLAAAHPILMNTVWEAEDLRPGRRLLIRRNSPAGSLQV